MRAAATRGTGGMDTPIEQSYLEGRSDVLRWTSEPLVDELAVSGWPELELHASSDREDTEWHVRLADEHPDGKAYEVAQGRMRAAYRDSFGDPTPLRPGETYLFRIELTALTHAFLPGHRLRVTLTSSDFPMYARSLNRFGSYRDLADGQAALNTITADSRIVLPVTRGSLPEDRR